jgi:hypothetical protein
MSLHYIMFVVISFIQLHNSTTSVLVTEVHNLYWPHVCTVATRIPPADQHSTCSLLIKGKGHPRTGHEGPEGEYKYSSTLSLTLVLDGDGWPTPWLATFPPGKRPSTHCIGCWVGPRASLDGCGNSRHHQDSIPGPASP